MKVLDDFDFTPRIFEKSGELEAVAWAESHGWIARKTQYQGRRGCPDRFFFGHGQIVPIEMKKRGKTPSRDGKLSAGQVEEFKRLAGVGVKVHVCHTAAEAIAVLESFMPLV